MKKEQPIGYHPGSTPHNNILSYFEVHKKTIPSRCAFRWTVSSHTLETAKKGFSYQEITYEELARDIEHVAAGLQTLGVAPGDRIVVFLPMGRDLYTAMFAVQRLGAIAVFLDSWARRNHLGACAIKASPKGIISFHEAFTLIGDIPEFSSVALKIAVGESALATTTLDKLRQTKECAPICPVESETTALITFTTGSSGVPKGANRTHRFLSAQHRALSEVIPYMSEDLDIPAFPIFCLNNLASGVTTYIPAIDLARPTALDGAMIAHQIIDAKVSCATLSPAMFNGVSSYAEKEGLQLTSLRRVVTGGAPISEDDIERFMRIAPQATPLVLYGSTEVEPMAEITGQEMRALSMKKGGSRKEGVNVGKLHHALKVKFVGLSKSPITFSTWKELCVESGAVGELIVSGDHVCRDYYNDPEAFLKTKIVDDNKVVWHRTGDLGRVDEEGNLWIVGRVHNAILRGGEYYFPVGAEILLKRIPQVRGAAYVGIPDKVLGEKAVVVLSLVDVYDAMPLTTIASPTSLIVQVKETLRQNKFPVDALHFLPTLPMDPRHHSKIEYEVLRGIIEREKPCDYV